VIVSGVDLAGQPVNTAIGIVRWRPERRSLELMTGADDDAVVATVLRTDRCGIDAPLGWPDAFVDVVTRHHSFQTADLPASSEPLRLRATDRFVWKTHGRLTLSESTDNIGDVAHRGIRIQQAVQAATGETIDRTGAGRLVEVYPAAALRVWGLPHRGYKRGDGAEATRASIVAGLAERFAIELAPDHTRLATEAHDALDALISAIVAALAAEGRTAPPPAALRRAAQREGWIHVPTPDGAATISE
jgi:predicted nuclease with RNAse H fold